MNKNAFSCFSIATTLALLLAIAVPARATLLFENNFNTEITNTSTGDPNANYSVGRAPVITDFNAFSLSGGMVHPSLAQNVTTLGGRGSTVFAPGSTGFATNSVAMYSHPAAYAGGPDAGSIQIANTAGVNGPLAGTASGMAEFGFKLSLASTELSTLSWGTLPTMSLVSNYDGGRRDPLFSFTFSQTNLFLISSSGAVGGAQDLTLLSTGLEALTPVSIVANVDMATRSFTVNVDGSQVGGTYYMLFDVGATPENFGIGGYKAFGGAPDTTSIDAFTHYYDDIYLQTVPEPSTWILLGSSLLVLVAFRNRIRLSRN